MSNELRKEFDFRTELSAELKLSWIGKETMLDEYVDACKNVAVKYKNQALAEEKERHEKEQAEFAKWCSMKNWVYLPSFDKWRKIKRFTISRIEEKTTQELLTEYRNQKH